LLLSAKDLNSRPLCCIDVKILLIDTVCAVLVVTVEAEAVVMAEAAVMAEMATMVTEVAETV
jgi:hypothetical protein